MKIIPIAVVASCLAAPMFSARTASSQQVTQSPVQAPARTRAIVASFNKSKHVVKERRGVRREKYKDVRSEPALKTRPEDYSGSYEVPGMGYTLDLRVDSRGNVNGTGYDPLDLDGKTMRQFTLTNAKLEGALLSGTKVYGNGARESFEGVFIDRTSFDSPTDKGVTTFGLGVVMSPVRVSGLNVERVFYQLKE